jgi:hypothetical protein
MTGESPFRQPRRLTSWFRFSDIAINIVPLRQHGLHSTETVCADGLMAE